MGIRASERVVLDVIPYILLWAVALPCVIVLGVLWLLHDPARRWDALRGRLRPGKLSAAIAGRRASRRAGKRDYWRTYGPPAARPVLAAVPPPAPGRHASPPSSPPPAVIPDDEPDPAEATVIASTAVPPDWAAVIARITGFEPEDDAAFAAFMRSEAAAYPALAEAWRAMADTLIHVIGLDPAAVQGPLELADVLGDCAHDVSLALRRYFTVYAQVIEAVSGGVRLPHHARAWLTGGTAA